MLTLMCRIVNKKFEYCLDKITNRRALDYPFILW
nr:MAG TPA: hypothetical protein [Caudoviricetes sp.]